MPPRRPQIPVTFHWSLDIKSGYDETRKSVYLNTWCQPRGLPGEDNSHAKQAHLNRNLWRRSNLLYRQTTRETNAPSNLYSTCLARPSDGKKQWVSGWMGGVWGGGGGVTDIHAVPLRRWRPLSQGRGPCDTPGYKSTQEIKKVHDELSRCI